MTYEDLYKEIANLGFSDVSELNELNEDSEGLVFDSINRAIEEININITSIIDSYVIEQTGEDEDYKYYDMIELADGFIDFTETPVMVGDGVYTVFSDYEIEADSIIVLHGGLRGKFKIFYKREHTPIIDDGNGGFNREQDVELPRKAHKLIPLLASYYVWLEDDATKATAYYNQYERLANLILQEKTQRARMKVLEGGI